jgi:hypothetical protein
MRRRVRFGCFALLMGFAANAAEPTGCIVRKGLYDSWLSLAKKPARTMPRVGALLGAGKPVVEPASAQEIHDNYQTYLQCLSDTPVPAGEDGALLMCKDADADRLGSLVCQLAVYLKTNRTRGTQLLDALPAGRKSADLVWDLDAITGAAASENHFPALFAPQGAAYKIVDELFVLALDDRDTAITKYFHIAGAAAGDGVGHTDAQIRLFLQESPMLVVKQWQVLRQYQPRLKKVLADLSKELSAAEMNKMRRGISGFCTKDNLDCPEIEKFFGRPQ